MDEKKEKETKETEKEEPTEDSDEGVQSKATSDLDRADEIVERRNRVCEREEKILNRKETLEARRTVGGETDAGIQEVKETDDEKWEKDAKVRYEGTGMDPTPDDSPTELR